MKTEHKIKISSNRSFGLTFFFVFLIISLWPLMSEGQIRLWSLIVCLIFLVLGFVKSSLLQPLNRLWFKFGTLLGSIIAPTVMGIIFFLVVTPTGFVMRALGKDLLRKKIDKNKGSYWINRQKHISKMKQQF